MNKSPTPNIPSRSQIFLNLFYSLVPIIGFLLVESFYGIEAGIVVAIILSLLEVIWVYWKERRWEPFSLFSAGLIIAMGAMSWYTNDETIILLKPAILEGVFAGIFLFSSLIGKPFILMLARKQFGSLDHLAEFQLRYFQGLNWRIGLVFLLHALLTVYAALWMSRTSYLIVKGGLFYVIFLVFLAAEFIYSRRSVRKYAEQAARERALWERQRQLVQQMREK